MNKKKKLFAGTFYTYMIYGFMVILTSSVMPYLGEDYGYSYKVRGIVLSTISFGGFISTFISAFLVEKIGKKKSAIIVSLAIAIGYLGFALTSSIPVIMGFSLILGLGIGGISYINNKIITDEAPGEAKYTNYLHTFFAIGALASPIFVGMFIENDLSWKLAVGIAASVMITVIITYIIVPLDNDVNIAKNSSAVVEEGTTFYKNPLFYLILIVVFLYSGAEYSVNNWLVTYLLDTNLVPSFMAQTLFSLWWIVIMLGRIFGAYMSSKVYKTTLLLINISISVAIFLVFLLSTNHIIISIAIGVIGFCFGPIFPTIIAAASSVINRNAKGMSIFFAISVLGKTAMPFLVGFVSDLTSIFGGMIMVFINIIILLIFTIILRVKQKE